MQERGFFVQEGEWVYYRMGQDPDWQGPGRVLGQDGKLIFIRHGRIYIVASPSRVIKRKEEFEFNQINTGHNEQRRFPTENAKPQTQGSDKSRHDTDPANST